MSLPIFRLGILRPKLNLQNLNKPMNYLYTNRRSVGIFGGLLLLILFSCCGIGRAAAQQQGADARHRDFGHPRKHHQTLPVRLHHPHGQRRYQRPRFDRRGRRTAPCGARPDFRRAEGRLRVRRAAGAYLQGGRTPPLLRVDDRGFGRRARRVGQSAGGRHGHGGRNLQGRYHRQRRALCAACRRRGVGAAIPLSGL